MGKILLSALTSVAVAVAVAVWAVPLAAHADSGRVVVCGQTLTHDTRLANDLVNCPADRLIIGADHITVDLAGHTIDGVNAAGSEGVSDDGHGGLRIQNGVIRDFFANGVALRGAPRSAVRNLTITRIGDGGVEGDASAGVLVKESAASTVTGNTVMNDVSAYQSDGYLGSDSVQVTGNVVSNHAVDGIVVGALKNARITGNTFTANGDRPVLLRSDRQRRDRQLVRR